MLILRIVHLLHILHFFLMLPFADVNIVTAIAGTIAAMILGMIWYGPLFGKQWMKLVGLKESDAKEGAGKAMAMGLITSFVSVYIIGMLLIMLQPETLKEGLMATGAMWLGFLAYNEFGNSIWARAPWNLTWINLGYSLVYVILITSIFMHWPA